MVSALPVSPEVAASDLPVPAVLEVPLPVLPVAAVHTLPEFPEISDVPEVSIPFPILVLVVLVPEVLVMRFLVFPCYLFLFLFLWFTHMDRSVSFGSHLEFSLLQKLLRYIPSNTFCRFHFWRFC